MDDLRGLQGAPAQTPAGGSVDSRHLQLVPPAFVPLAQGQASYKGGLVGAPAVLRITLTIFWNRPSLASLARTHREYVST